jgi:hypothetical protein
MSDRDFHLGDTVAYPINRNGEPRREAVGVVDGFQLPPGWARRLYPATHPVPMGRVRVIGSDGKARLFGRPKLRLVRAFDQVAA